jgi:beta-1,2-mannobiose phosphorylase / 1,2-beta-oligomannan phosphorylase
MAVIKKNKAQKKVIKKTLKKKVVSKRPIKKILLKKEKKTKVTKKNQNKKNIKGLKKNTKKISRRKILSKSKSKKVIKLKRKAVNLNFRKINKKHSPALEKSHLNPILKPREDSHWESRAAFNPTALLYDGKIHIIYRAVGNADVSVFGYALSEDGHNVLENSKELAYYHSQRLNTKKRKVSQKILYGSGGGTSGGAEDPRLTQIDDIIYMTYTAFDGWGSVRVAMTSISLEDFISKRWNWENPVFISPPGQLHKNWVIFPEKIKGKFAILHSISPTVMIDYFDSLEELDGDNFIWSVHQDSPLWQMRDRLVRGVGPAPIKTKYGWLILYHGMEKHETHKYKLWAMILDEKDPTKVLYKSDGPILEPEEDYENNGHKFGVIYSCGAIVKDGMLFVYYGGSDKVTCVATADLEKFLKELTKKHKVQKIHLKSLKK